MENTNIAVLMAARCTTIFMSTHGGNAQEDINLNDYTKNAETFAGYYGGIIQRVKELQPDAHFFVVTLPKQYGNKDNNSI